MKKTILLAFVAILSSCSESESCEPIDPYTDPYFYGTQEDLVGTWKLISIKVAGVELFDPESCYDNNKIEVYEDGQTLWTLSTPIDSEDPLSLCENETTSIFRFVAQEESINFTILQNFYFFEVTQGTFLSATSIELQLIAANQYERKTLVQIFEKQ